MPDSKFLAALAAVLVAIATWGVLYFLCGRWGRKNAVAGFGLVFLAGLSYCFDLPWYSYLAAASIAMLFFHRSVRGRLEKAARAVDPLEVPDLRVSLRWTHDETNRHLAVWRAGAAAEGDGAPAAAGGPAASTADRGDVAVAAPATLRLWLDFVGFLEDEYEVALCGEAPRIIRGALIVHHKEASGHCTGVLGHLDPVEGIPGQEGWMTVRAAPADFARQLLDFKAVALLHDLFDFQSDDREIYVQVEGRAIRIGASSEFGRNELQLFLGVGARWIQRVREVSVVL